VAAQSGNNVNLVDLSENVLKKASGTIENSLKRIAKKHFKVLTLVSAVKLLFGLLSIYYEHRN